MSDLSGNPVPNNSSDELDWFAFQYLSNALSEQESQQFEELLAEQQSAREALATAVQLVAGLKSIESSPVSTFETAKTKLTASNSSPSRTWQWALTGCAVALLFTVSYLLSESSFWTTTNSQIVQTEPSQDDLGHLLDLWSESAEYSSITLSSNSSTEQTDLIDQQNTLVEGQNLEVPDWLYTAVSLPEESVN